MILDAPNAADCSDYIYSTAFFANRHASKHDNGRTGIQQIPNGSVGLKSDSHPITHSHANARS